MAFSPRRQELLRIREKVREDLLNVQSGESSTYRLVRKHLTEESFDRLATLLTMVRLDIEPFTIESTKLVTEIRDLFKEAKTKAEQKVASNPVELAQLQALIDSLNHHLDVIANWQGSWYECFWWCFWVLMVLMVILVPILQVLVSIFDDLQSFFGHWLGAVASVPIALVIGTLMFLWRAVYRFGYGIFEMLAGASLMTWASHELAAKGQGAPYLIALLGSAYIVVRGLDNVNKSRKYIKEWEFKWTKAP